MRTHDLQPSSLIPDTTRHRESLAADDSSVSYVLHTVPTGNRSAPSLYVPFSRINEIERGVRDLSERKTRHPMSSIYHDEEADPTYQNF